MNYTPHNFSQNVSRKNNLIEISNNDSVTIDKASVPKVIYFTAKWCGPCKKISPLFLSTAKNNPSVNFFKVDIDENSELAAEYGITTIPSFHFHYIDCSHLVSVVKPWEIKKEVLNGADEDKFKKHMAKFVF